MKKLRSLLTFVMSLLCFGSALPWGYVQAFAEKKSEIVLIDNKPLTVSFEVSPQKDENVWQINVRRTSENEEQLQRIKFKLQTEAKEKIVCPKINGLKEQDGWLKESTFTAKSEQSYRITLPRKQKKLLLYIQMDEQILENRLEKQDVKIKTDILDNQDPFILEASKDIETERSRAGEARREKTGEGIMNQQIEPPAQETLMTATTKKRYTNKKPNYEDKNGLAPKYSWVPSGQTNVSNHQGGFEKNSGWDKISDWDINQDDHSKSYITYGETAEEPNIALRKLAMETATKDEFTIRLNVKGNSIQKPGIDMYFVLDNSSSMANETVKINGKLRKTLAVASLRKLIDRLSEHQPKGSNYFRIGGAVFSDYQPSARNQTFALSNQPSDWKKMVDSYEAITPYGDTFTQKAMDDAKTVLEKGNADRQKLLFVLTDGAPNMSWLPLSGSIDHSMYYDQIRITNSDKRIIDLEPQFPVPSGFTRYGYYNHLNAYNGSTKLVPAMGSDGYIMKNDKKVIHSHLTTANTTAAELRESGIEIHSVGIGLGKKVQTEKHTTEEIIKGMYRMANRKLSSSPNSDLASDYFFYQAENEADFDESLNEWFDTVIQTVDRGTLTDPLGDMVELVEKPSDPIQVSNGAPPIEGNKKPKISVSSDNRTIIVDNINLYAGQEIELEYKVRLKTEDKDFISNHWYQTNKETTLEPTPERTTDKIEFGVPSVRAQIKDFVIPVEKHWSDARGNAEEFWKEKRPTEITALLKRKGGSNWVDAEVPELTLNEGNNWKGAFAPVEGGAENTYQVIERVGNKDKSFGYGKPTYNTDSFTSETPNFSSVIITNTLLTTDYTFKKVGHTENTLFTGNDRPKFTISSLDPSIELAKNVSPGNDGLLKITDLPVGKYKVTETYVPQGYIKAADFEIEVTEKSDGSGVFAKVGEKEGKTIVYNRLADFTLTIKKKDTQGNELKGAAFKLSQTIGGTYEKELSDGPTFVFEGLKPGKYKLEETKAPTSYHGLTDVVTVEIKDDGTIVSPNHPLITENVVGHKIEWTIKNTPVNGQLPVTGDSGNRLLLGIAFTLVLTGVLAGVIHLYVSYK